MPDVIAPDASQVFVASKIVKKCDAAMSDQGKCELLDQIDIFDLNPSITHALMLRVGGSHKRNSPNVR